MKWITAALALLLGLVLSGCGPTTPAPAAPSPQAPSVPANISSAPVQNGDSAWEKYKQEVRDAGFVNPNKDDGSVTDDQVRQGTEEVCRGPGGANGIWELYKISIQMKPQQVDMPRIKQATIDFCASAGQ